MIYSFSQLEALWIDVGGSRSNAAVMASVALAESGGDPSAVSSTNDYGLWQINSIHAGSFPAQWRFWATPGDNAVMAKAISSDGNNVAAWCTCWNNPNRDCGHGYLHVPQPGSPAGRQLAAHGGAGGLVPPTTAPIPPPVAPPNPTHINDAWQLVQHKYGPQTTQQANLLKGLGSQLRRAGLV